MAEFKPKFPFNQHSLNAVHPFVFLLGSGSRDAVEGVVPFDDPSVRLCLTCLDHLVLIVRDEELKAVLRSKHMQTITCLTTRRRQCVWQWILRLHHHTYSTHSSVQVTVWSLKCEISHCELFTTCLCIRTPLALLWFETHYSMDMLLGCRPSVEFYHGKRSLCKHRDRFCKSTPPHTRSEES